MEYETFRNSVKTILQKAAMDTLENRLCSLFNTPAEESVIDESLFKSENGVHTYTHTDEHGSVTLSAKDNINGISVHYPENEAWKPIDVDGLLNVIWKYKPNKFYLSTANMVNLELSALEANLSFDSLSLLRSQDVNWCCNVKLENAKSKANIKHVKRIFVNDKYKLSFCFDCVRTYAQHEKIFVTTDIKSLPF